MYYGVPEQSPKLMESLSSGTSFFEDSFLFISSDFIPEHTSQITPKLTPENTSESTPITPNIGFPKGIIPFGGGLGRQSLPTLNLTTTDITAPTKTTQDIENTDWLMAIGYPLEGTFSTDRFLRALNTVKAKLMPNSCFAIAPDFPEELQKHIIDIDIYYNLALSKPTQSADFFSSLGVPLSATFRRILKKTDEALGQGIFTIDVTTTFTTAHRDLWLEFLGRRAMSPRVRSLYANIPLAVQEQKADIRFINAWDRQKNLSACLVMDFSQKDAISYILGAHSRKYYIPHASDALMKHCILLAQKEEKNVIYLGLGVNEGITRFKQKWGAKTGEKYALAVWEEAREESLKKSITNVMQAFLAPSHTKIAKAKYINELPKQRPYAMLWELEKKGKISWIGGTAHFFCYSFENSFRDLYEKVDTVLFEGPLDQTNLQRVAKHGQSPKPDSKRVIDAFTEAEIRALERCIYGYQGFGAKLFQTGKHTPPDVRHILANSAPWYAFFTLWSAWLSKQGWEDSVDMEAYYIALEMEKNVFGMEDIQEQIISLESAPYERIVRFLKNHTQWHDYRKKNIKAYLGGNLQGMPGTSAEFPTVAERVIGPRDERFRQRMRPFIETGKTMVFVGSAHMNNLRSMLAEDGFNVKRVLPSFSHKMKHYFNQDPEFFIPASQTPQPHTKGEHVRSPLSPLLEENFAMYLQTNTPKNFFTAEALVPEQLEHYVRAVSSSKALIIQDEEKSFSSFIAWKQEGALILIAFPTVTSENRQLANTFKSNGTDNVHYVNTADNAIRTCIRIFQQSKASTFILLSPFSIQNTDYKHYFTLLPKAPHFTQDASECWYFMDLPFTPKQKLRNMLTRAEQDINIHQEIFTQEHADLIDFYLKTRLLKDGTRHIFKNLKKYTQSSPHVILFSARDKNNILQGFSIGDFSSPYTAFYMFAFRRKQSPPGTSDLLLKHIVDEAQKRGQNKINLGLGISEGISSFKKKWNAYQHMPHVETAWSMTSASVLSRSIPS